MSGYYLKPGGGLQVIGGRFATVQDMKEIARRGREAAERKALQIGINGMSYLETYQRKLRLRKVVNFIIAENRTEHRQELADFSAELASLELGCSVPEVLSLDTQKFPNHAGFSQQGRASVIYIWMDMSLFDIARTAAHETRHRWQIETGKFAEMSARKEHEADAEKFEEEFVEKYLQGEK